MNIESLRARLDHRVKAARDITTKAEREKRSLTASERADVETHIGVAAEVKQILDGANDDHVRRQLGSLSGGSSGGSDLFADFKSAGWAPGKRVHLDARRAFKDVAFEGDMTLEDVSTSRVQGAGLGADRRRLYNVFRAQAVGADVTAVSVVSQSGRVLPLDADVVRDIDAVTPKPEVTSELELRQMPLRQVAAVQTGVPNVVLAQGEVRNVVNTDLRLTYENGIEAIVRDAIDAAAPAAGSAGGDLAAAVIYAAADMAEDGHRGSVLVISPQDAADLALLRGTDEVFARRDPLVDFTIVAVPGVMDGYLIDPSSAGRLFLSAPSLASFEENDGQTNSQTVRFEGHAGFHVDRVSAIRMLTVGI